MTNTTRKKIHSAEFKTAEQLLSKLISANQTSAQYFLNDFLTDAEKIMLIKRFASVWMFAEGYSQYDVWNTLFISPTTAQRIYRDWSSGRYQAFVKNTQSKNRDSILALIQDFITAQADSKARARLLARAIGN